MRNLVEDRAASILGDSGNWPTIIMQTTVAIQIKSNTRSIEVLHQFVVNALYSNRS